MLWARTWKRYVVLENKPLTRTSVCGPWNVCTHGVGAAPLEVRASGSATSGTTCTECCIKPMTDSSTGGHLSFTSLAPQMLAEGFSGAGGSGGNVWKGGDLALQAPTPARLAQRTRATCMRRGCRGKARSESSSVRWLHTAGPKSTSLFARSSHSHTAASYQTTGAPPVAMHAGHCSKAELWASSQPATAAGGAGGNVATCIGSGPLKAMIGFTPSSEPNKRRFHRLTSAASSLAPIECGSGALSTTEPMATCGSTAEACQAPMPLSLSKLSSAPSSSRPPTPPSPT
mmetsp:Transcript_125999/g.314858  ORF Transcript_125999/g.314858 Transcript_125999/m.314858 type:complete len:287 (+) Transcript_125999:412-1272(+)